jgi:hypothetical protein
VPAAHSVLDTAAVLRSRVTAYIVTRGWYGGEVPEPVRRFDTAHRKLAAGGSAAQNGTGLGGTATLAHRPVDHHERRGPPDTNLCGRSAEDVTVATGGDAAPA